MYKGQKTRQEIVRKAFAVFNAKGYEAASISDLMDATGLKKGGIYNHFKSKDDLASEAFSFALGEVATLMKKRMECESTPAGRLRAAIEHFVVLGQEQELFSSGCPLMNAAIESDCGYPEIREQVRTGFSQLISLIEDQFSALEKERGQLPFPPGKAALHLVSSMEGALMLTLINQSAKPCSDMKEILLKVYAL